MGARCCILLTTGCVFLGLTHCLYSLILKYTVKNSLQFILLSFLKYHVLEQVSAVGCLCLKGWGGRCACENLCGVEKH